MINVRCRPARPGVSSSHPGTLKETRPCPHSPWKTVAADLDVRPGGQMYVTMQSPDGDSFPNTGIYLDVTPGKQVVFSNSFSENWTPENPDFQMVAILDFEDLGNGMSRYTATVKHWSAGDREKHKAMGFADGWNKVLDQLIEVAGTLPTGHPYS